MPTKVEVLRCSECGHTLTRDKFSEICFADSRTKAEYLDLIEDGECPECEKGWLEEE